MTTANRHKLRTAFHGILFFAALVIVNVSSPSLSWPWYLLVPVLVYSTAIFIVAPLRRTAPKLAIGGLGGWPLAYAALLALTTTGVLAGFQALIQPDTNELAAKLPTAWFGSVLLAGVGFSVVNAVLEEVIFRGILWNLVSDEWNQAVALGVTAAIFGVGHLHGYRPGPIGALMAGLYGIALGLLRWWTGGLGLAIACHIAADATIFCILVLAPEFDTP